MRAPVSLGRAARGTGAYFCSTGEQWVAADFHVPESLTQVSLQMADDPAYGPAVFAVLIIEKTLPV